MPRLPDIVDGLQKQRMADAEDVRGTGEELRKLRPAYQRYRELTANLDSKVERVKITVALLAEQDGDDLGALFEFLDSIGVPLQVPGDIREEIPLWKMIREVVRQVEELRIVELENVMNSLKIKASRQALESAIEAHKRTFKTRRSGREKFVGLKH